MTLAETLEDIKETVANSIIYVSIYELDNYLCSLGAFSYFEDNTERDFNNDGVPCWYFPKFEAWIAIEKEYNDRYTIKLNEAYVID